MLNFTDAVLMDGAPRITSDGYLVASARAARTGVQVYLRRELGLDGEGTINVYRPESEVFQRDSLASYAAKPVTIDHPAAPVDADTWRDVGVGHVGTDVMRDGDFVRVPLILMDADGIERAQSTHTQISMGYSAEIVMQDGVAPDGTPYEAEQRHIRINHLAFVSQARGGERLRIGDANTDWGVAPMADDAPEAVHQVMVDGVSVDTHAVGAKAIAALINDRDAAHRALAKAEARLAHEDAGPDFEARVETRAALIVSARTLVRDLRTEGLDDAGVRRAVVAARLGEGATAGRSQAYIDARFDILAEGAGGDVQDATDPFRTAVAGGLRPHADLRTEAVKARDAAMQSLRDAWKALS